MCQHAIHKNKLTAVRKWTRGTLGISMPWESQALWVLLGIRPNLFSYRTVILDVKLRGFEKCINPHVLATRNATHTLCTDSVHIFSYLKYTRTLYILLLYPAQMITLQAAIKY
jgi:hypothetical protein